MCDWVREVEHASYSVQYTGLDPERSVLLPSNVRESVFVRVFWVLFLIILLGLGIAIGCYLIFQEDRGWPSHAPYIFMDRAGWRASPPTGPILRYTSGRPLTHVMLTDTHTSACGDTDACGELVRRIQTNNINMNMSDVGYNFLVSGDGTTYEGRGWNQQPVVSREDGVAGNSTLLVSLIGTFDDISIPEEQSAEFQVLLQEGVERGALDECYLIMLHKDNIHARELHRIYDKFVAQNKNRKASLKCTT